MNISGLVITFNEKANIKDCIISLNRVCNEIIIIDSFSDDKTIEIAESMGYEKFILKNFWVMDYKEYMDYNFVKMIGF